MNEMVKQNRTEFRVLQAGKERRLFTISESPDGSLVLLQNTKTSNFGSGRLTEVGDLHLTAHSRRAFDNIGIFGHKFKTTHRNKEDDLYERSVIVQASLKSPKLLWILDSAIFGALTDDRYDIGGADPKTKEIVPLLSYFPFEDALHYTLLVHDKSIDIKPIQGFDQYTHRFRELSLTILVTYSDATPDPKTGHLDGTASLHHYTQGGALTINGKLVTPQGKIEKPIHTRNLEMELQRLHLDLANKYSSLDMSHQKGRLITPANFHRWSSVGTMDGVGYGVIAEIGRPMYFSSKFPDGTPKPKNLIQTPGSRLLLSGETLDPSLIGKIARLRAIKRNEH